ncbi:MAG: orotidine 5'-phosphate decarboxylase, partial [Candidatus Thorarchaeota archaeon]
MGLDPRMDHEGEIPQYLIKELEEPNKIIFEFNKILIENTNDLIPIIKPQIAFYEKYDALDALKET